MRWRINDLKFLEILLLRLLKYFFQEKPTIVVFSHDSLVYRSNSQSQGLFPRFEAESGNTISKFCLKSSMNMRKKLLSKR